MELNLKVVYGGARASYLHWLKHYLLPCVRCASTPLFLTSAWRWRERTNRGDNGCRNWWPKSSLRLDFPAWCLGEEVQIQLEWFQVFLGLTRNSFFFVGFCSYWGLETPRSRAHITFRYFSRDVDSWSIFQLAPQNMYVAYLNSFRVDHLSGAKKNRPGCTCCKSMMP